jgi:hypothetical protein
MSTIWHCNKERERNNTTPPCERSILKYCFIVELFEKWRNCPPPPPLRRLILAAHFGGPFWRLLATQFGVSPRVGVANSRHQVPIPGGGGGWLGLPSRELSPKNKELVFWLFLLSYMTSGPFSWWYFLLLKQRFFWYYFSRQVMAILCCVAQKAASAAQICSFAGFSLHPVQNYISCKPLLVYGMVRYGYLLDLRTPPPRLLLAIFGNIQYFLPIIRFSSPQIKSISYSLPLLTVKGRIVGL